MRCDCCDACKAYCTANAGSPLWSAAGLPSSECCSRHMHGKHVLPSAGGTRDARHGQHCVKVGEGLMSVHSMHHTPHADAVDIAAGVATNGWLICQCIRQCPAQATPCLWWSKRRLHYGQNQCIHLHGNSTPLLLPCHQGSKRVCWVSA